MKILQWMLALLLSIPILSYSQNRMTGTVTETLKDTRLENVFVKDMTNKQVALTDKAGRFEISTALNHTLIFILPGYVSDTLYVIDLKPKFIEMKILGIGLRQVDVNAAKNGFNPREEYAEIYRNSTFALSPSRIFGKQAKDSRRLKKYFENEIQQRQIDSVYNRVLVSSIVPLKGTELDNFMALYRPTLPFLKATTPQALTLYINDSYKKFMALPPEKRNGNTLNN